MAFSEKGSRIIKLSGLLMLVSMLTVTGGNINGVAELHERSKSDIKLQERTITGTVVDFEGESLPGVSIVVTGTTIGTLSDVDGTYSLTVPPDAGTLTFSFVGMLTQVLEIGNRTVINVSMEEDAIGLEEVIVVGYGTQRRADLTGAVSSVSSQEVEGRFHVTNTAQAMAGLSPGLTIQNFAGEPGSESVRIRIRGHGTLNNANPLILVDGIEQSLGAIEPRDIESISILKDAASAAIYGSRAANGVILITTKRGTDSGTQVTYDSNFGMQNMLGYPPWADVEDWMRLENEAMVNAGSPPIHSEEHIQNAVAGTNPIEFPWTVYEDYVFRRNAPQHRHSLSLSTGGDFGKVFASVNYTNQAGIIHNFGNKNLSARINADLNASERLTFSVNLLARDRNSFGPGHTGQRITQGMLHINRNLVGRYPDGTWDLFGGQWNSIAMMDTGERSTLTDEIIGTLGFNYQILPTLSFQGDITRKTINRDYSEFVESLAGMRHYVTGDPVTVGGWFAVAKLWERQDNTKEWSQRAYLNYNETIGSHNIQAMTGYEEIYNSYKWIQAYRQDFFSNELRSISAGGAHNQTSTGARSEWRLLSFFGRVNYSFENKYLFQANIRYDGSSRFGPGNRWGLFPSFSAGWRVSQEDFLINHQVISNLRLRASWGQLGNQQIGLYRYLSNYNLGQNYAFNNNVVPGSAITSAGNPGITWETTTMRNIGLDIGVFDNRIDVSAEYFWNYTADILLNLPIPPSIGVGAPTQNAAAVSNKGYEIALNYRSPGRRDGGFQYSVGLNFSDVVNTIEDLAGTGPYFPDKFTVWQEGYSMNSLRGLKSPGLYRTEEDLEKYPVFFNPSVGIGDIIYEDLNGDGVITQSLYPDGDQYIMANEDPRYEFGITGRISFRSWDFSMFWQGVLQQYHTVDGALNEGPNNLNFISREMARETFHPTRNPEGTYPLVRSGNNWSLLETDFWLQDTKYVRLKNFQVGYMLRPPAYAESVRIYIAGENLLTWTGTELFDPETPRGRHQFFPHTKIMSAGVSVRF